MLNCDTGKGLIGNNLTVSMVASIMVFRTFCYTNSINEVDYMDKISANQAKKELTMMLMYLSRFTDNDRLSGSKDNITWKGYDFDILNGLDDEDFIRQGEHPYRNKTVFITDSGIDYAKELLEKYGISECD